MYTKRKKISHQAPLIIENHPEDYIGYPFITLLQYNKDHLLTIVDNSDDATITAFVLDMCGPERIDEEMIIDSTRTWYTERRERFPVSFEFSRLNITNTTSKIYRTFNVDYITRVIGPLPSFVMAPSKNVRRRKRKPLPANIPIQTKS